MDRAERWLRNNFDSERQRDRIRKYALVMFNSARAFAYYFSYQNENAIAYFDMAIILNHNPAYAYKCRADVKRDQYRLPEAKVDYLVFLKSTPKPLFISDLSIRGYENAKKC